MSTIIESSGLKKRYKVRVIKMLYEDYTVMAFDEQDAVVKIKQGFGRSAGASELESVQILIREMSDKDLEFTKTDSGLIIPV